MVKYKRNYTVISSSFLKSLDDDIVRTRQLVTEILGDDIVVITSETVEIEPLLFAVDIEAMTLDGLSVLIRILKGDGASTSHQAYYTTFGQKKLEMLLHSATLPKTYIILLYDEDPTGLGVPYTYSLTDLALEITTDEIVERAHDVTVVTADAGHLREVIPDVFVRDIYISN